MAKHETTVARARLRYRAERRGLRETELLLGGFWAAHGEAMNDRRAAHFAALLEEADPDIWAWVAFRQSPPARIDAKLIAALRAFRPGGCSPPVERGEYSRRGEGGLVGRPLRQSVEHDSSR